MKTLAALSTLNNHHTGSNRGEVKMRLTKYIVLGLLLIASAAIADDFCVTCPPSARSFKCVSNLGGEFGRIECGVRNSGCSVTFFDGRTCGNFVKDPFSLRAHVKWAIFHEGCNVFAGNNMRSAAELRGCYLGVQRHNDEAIFQINNAGDPELTAVTQQVSAEIPAEFQLPTNFYWVCEHEGLGRLIHDLRARGDFGGIRGIYANAQGHNPNARNLLAAMSDDQVASTVDGSCPPVEMAPRVHIRF